MRALAAGLLVAAVALTGCSLLDVQTPQVQPCEWMSERVDGPATRTMILLDRSNSTVAAASGELQPDYVERLTRVVESEVDDKAVVSIGVFGGASTSVQWVVRDLRTDRGRENAGLQQDDREEARDCLTGHLVAAAAIRPRAPGSDIIGALAMAKLSMVDRAGGHRIVLATDGLATTGCADLTKVAVGVPSLIDDLRSNCEAVPQPVDLGGAHVTMVGIGHPAGRQPQPATSQLFWLNTLWQGLCTDLNATCEVSSDPISVAADGGVPAEAGLDEPQVTFTPPEEGLSRDHGTVFQLDTEVLFETNSATILPAGAATLERIVARIRAMPPVTIRIDGFTEGQASPAANYVLAKSRADAVAAVLTAGGLTVAEAAGHEGTAPMCPVARPDAPKDDPARQCNRRVDIVVTERR